MPKPPASFDREKLNDYAKLVNQKVAEWLGVSWEELQNLPRAEVAFAIVARRDHEPAFILLVDQGEEGGQLDDLPQPPPEIRIVGARIHRPKEVRHGFTSPPLARRCGSPLARASTPRSPAPAA